MTTRRRDLVANATDEEQLDNATRVTQSRAQQEKSDILKVYGTPEGRRELWRLLEECAVHRTSFRGDPQPFSTFFNEGQRNIGLWFEARIMNHAPHLYIQMRDESARESS